MPERNQKVLWIHNYSGRSQGMFLWDILDAMPSTIEIEQLQVPTRPKLTELLRQMLALRRNSASYDLVHAHFGSAVGLIGAAAKCPFILSLRGTDLYRYPARGLFGKASARLRQIFTYFASLRAATIVVMSERMRTDLRRWPLMKRKQIVVVTDPVGQEFLDTNGGRSDVDPSMPLKVFVGSFGASNPIKRVEIVEGAASLCSSAGIPVELRVVTGKPRSQMKDELRASDLVALASIHEGFPNVVKEGLTQGLPFIATDVSDLATLAKSAPGSRIVRPGRLEFALAFVDALFGRGDASGIAQFRPLTVASKHMVIYAHSTGPR
jgi:teichuronic acid biosynthesis glycosyltransferase TuaC